MRKIMFIGRSEAGKTTIKQALKGESIRYHKTQYVNHYDVVIDTPGEYAETKTLAGALAVYSCEADVIGLLISATEPFCVFPPNITSISNREVIGVVTKINDPYADVEQATLWCQLAGCKKVFPVDSVIGEGIPEILEYLAEEGDVLPWEEAKAAYDNLSFKHGNQDGKDIDYQITVI